MRQPRMTLLLSSSGKENCYWSLNQHVICESTNHERDFLKNALVFGPAIGGSDVSGSNTRREISNTEILSPILIPGNYLYNIVILIIRPSNNI